MTRPAPLAVSLGDPAGIGPEIMAAAVDVMQAASTRFDLKLAL